MKRLDGGWQSTSKRKQCIVVYDDGLLQFQNVSETLYRCLVYLSPHSIILCHTLESVPWNQISTIVAFGISAKRVLEQKRPNIRIVLYQTEQYGSLWFNNAAYIETLRLADGIIDYDAVNLEHILTNPKLQPWIRDKTLAVLPFWHYPVPYRVLRGVEATRRYDVLFFGSLSERRLSVLNRIDALGYRVHCIEQDKRENIEALIQQSHIVLNIHYDDKYTILEMARINLLLSVGAYVVSEKGENEHLTSLLCKCVKFCDTCDGIVETCHTLLQEQNRSSLDLGRTQAQSYYTKNIRLDTYIQEAKDLDSSIVSDLV